MSPVGPITRYLRRFLDDRDTVGFTVTTCGFRGWTVREFPSLGLKCDQMLEELPFHEEIRLLYSKYYQITKSDNIKYHPVLTTSFHPFLFLGELLSRCLDDRIAVRSCNYTKVSHTYAIATSDCIVIFISINF